MNKIKAIIICCCVICLFSCSSQSSQLDSISGTVTKVISGQTVEVILTNSTQTSQVVKVRIIGIDAPDLRQSPWGKAAKQRLSELVMNQPIKLTLQTLNTDRYQRLNAHLWVLDTLVSQQLVKEGCVLANTGYDHTYSKLLIDSQEYARLMGYGIWNPQNPMRYPPNQFRLNNKN
ncbi:nuclease, SNase-like protein [Chondrocystis sp. NIES-4102]|nr:nuclease, SNase-like protein [Chondrocystis sp. NIES-4102]